MAGVVCVVAASGAWAEAPSKSSPVVVRSRRVELHYRRIAPVGAGQVALWYTRDFGATWQSVGTDEDGKSPFLFEAPAEGLYGVRLQVHRTGEAPPAPPQPDDPPQRWVFVDYTPPLVQWGTVEPMDHFARERRVRLTWTAHDDHLLRRPVTLLYQSSVDQVWQPIEAQHPNTGRYEWKVPASLAGQVTLKLIARDRGGHVVERSFGPVALDRWLEAPTATTRPAAIAKPTATTRPARGAAEFLDPFTRRRAQASYERGHRLLGAGLYRSALEGCREALELDPSLRAARYDLAECYRLMRDYPRAIEHYENVLGEDENDLTALRGAALAHVKQRQYPQSREKLRRLLDIDETDGQAWLDLGDVLFQMDRRPLAGSYWQRASNLSAPDDDLKRQAEERLARVGQASPTPREEGGS